MTPCSPHESCLTLYFLANNASHKFDEIKNDTHCNVNFFNTKTTSWASYSGKAKIIEDRALIKANWSPFVSAYFGDLKDGVHKGDENDPRVSLIEVVPDEIRYWVATRDAVGRAFEEGLGALTGKVSAPGELRTITKSDMQLAEGLHK
ncbi:hypothetical protein AX16_005258 [Volvariella volvacea WC 439]|nr:hypothetical protein AX16_005258 [Volvariella volvacea WC 439]